MTTKEIFVFAIFKYPFTNDNYFRAISASNLDRGGSILITTFTTTEFPPSVLNRFLVTKSWFIKLITILSTRDSNSGSDSFSGNIRHIRIHALSFSGMSAYPFLNPKIVGEVKFEPTETGRIPTARHLASPEGVEPSS